jgi:Beta-galactosidase
MSRLALLPLVLLVACSSDPAPPVEVEVDAGPPRTHTVTVNADGSFTPSRLEISEGDTVEWTFASPTDAIVASASDDCASALPYDPASFTGPMPIAASGIFTLGPAEAPYLSLDSTWESDQISGVFIRLEWSAVQPTEDTFDFSALDHEVDQAVRHGKLYNLAFKAGSTGTPAWLFTTGGVTPLELQDSGSDNPGCGPKMILGSPTDPVYQEHYFRLLREVAAHLRARGDRYRALAYIKPSGANLFSHENRLPKRCSEGCICNPQVFAEHGYTPTKLAAFYAAQTQLLADEFPDKTMGYALIQAGFPLVNDDGDYETVDGSSSGGNLPGGSAQTQRILDEAQATHGLRFAVAHNGMQVKPPDGTCPNQGKHPAVAPYADIGPCPNRWVLEEGAQGQVTGFQTNNADGVSTPAHLESSLQNLWDNSDGVYLEIYEQRLFEANGDVLDASASGRTLAQWDEELHQRRRAFFPTLPDPRPLSHRHTFTGTTAGEERHYLHPASCQAGVIVVR